MTVAIKQGVSTFRTDDELSAWTERLAQEIPYPAMQFDERSIGRTREKSRLYYCVLPGGYLCIDVYAPNVNDVSGCVVFIISPDMDDYPQVVVPGNDKFSAAIDAFLEVAASLSDGLHLAESEDQLPKRRDGLDERQLFELGRLIHELRTGNPFPNGITAKGRPSRRRRAPQSSR